MTVEITVETHPNNMMAALAAAETRFEELGKVNGDPKVTENYSLDELAGLC